MLANGDLWTGSDRGSVRVWNQLASAAGVSPFTTVPPAHELLLSDGKQGHQHEIKLFISLEAHGFPAVWTACKAALHVWDPVGRRHLQALPAAGATCAAATKAGNATTVWTGHADGQLLCWQAKMDNGPSNGLPVMQMVRLLGPGLSPRTGGPQPRSRPGHTPEKVCTLLAVSAPPLPDQKGQATVLWAGFSSGVVHAYEAVAEKPPPVGGGAPILTSSTGEPAAEDTVTPVNSAPPVLWVSGGGGDHDKEIAGLCLLPDGSVVAASVRGLVQRHGDGALPVDRMGRVLRRAVPYPLDPLVEEIDLCVATWNINAKSPPISDDQEDDTVGAIRDWITASGGQQRDPPALYAVGFQEVVKLDAKGMATHISTDKDTKEMHRWGQALTQALTAPSVQTDGTFGIGGQYVLVGKQQLVGVLVFVYAEKRLAPRIKRVQTSTVACGVGGVGGNKGAAAVRLTIDDAELAFVCCHMAAHQSHVVERNENFEYITDKMTMHLESGDRSGAGAQASYRAAEAHRWGQLPMNQHDAVFFFGDTNYRVDVDRGFADTQIVQHRAYKDASEPQAAQAALAPLLQKDQLLAQRNPATRRSSCRPVEWLAEQPITFEPSYKYDVGTDVYDTSEKMRVPAWTDRILYGPTISPAFPAGGGTKITPRWYGVAAPGLSISDHKPVSGLFTLSIGKLDPAGLHLATEAWQNSSDYVEAKRAIEAQRAVRPVQKYEAPPARMMPAQSFMGIHEPGDLVAAGDAESLSAPGSKPVIQDRRGSIIESLDGESDNDDDDGLGEVSGGVSEF